jgi:hypothetical protein
VTIVIGAGMAGLLASAMLRNECSSIIEAQNKVPNNHSAVLRFRSHIVGDVLNIPFKKVSVMKAVHPWLNPIADAFAYSKKTNGSLTLRSIITADATISERFIAPSDFIQRMVDCLHCEIMFDCSVTKGMFECWKLSNKYVISTMPMPILMDILGWEKKEEFYKVSGTNITFKVSGLDAYCSLYVPDPLFEGSRISVTGSEVVIECHGNHGDIVENSRSIIANSCRLLGIDDGDEISNVQIKRQTYSKILPYNDEDRKKFIMWATENWNIYSLGRFATWRPGLLLDDLVEDIRIIHRMIKNKSVAYSYRKSYS